MWREHQQQFYSSVLLSFFSHQTSCPSTVWVARAEWIHFASSGQPCGDRSSPPAQWCEPLTPASWGLGGRLAWTSAGPSIIAWPTHLTTPEPGQRNARSLKPHICCSSSFKCFLLFRDEKNLWPPFLFFFFFFFWERMFDITPELVQPSVAQATNKMSYSNISNSD